MDQKIFYDENADKFIKHKREYNQIDIFGIEFVENLIKSGENKVILDYGCGNGDLAIRHLKRGAKFVLGVDISKELLQYALNKTMNLGKIEFLSVDANNVCFDAIVPENMFDHIVSYYVLCTIPQKSVIENIVFSMYKKIKQGGSFITLLPNRDRFNGKTCYGFSCINKDPLIEGEEVITYLKTEDTSPLPIFEDPNSKHLKLTDYYWSQETLKGILENAGFTVNIHEIFIPKDHYKGIADESDFSPIYIFEAIK